MIALSLALIYRPTRFFNFAHGAVLLWGAYLAFAVHVLLKLPFWFAILWAVIGTALLGILLYAGIFGPMKRSGSSPLVLLLVSLGLYTILQNVISLFFGDETKTLNLREAREGISFLGAHATPVQFMLVLSCGVCFALAAVLMRRSRVGKAFRAVSSNPLLARIVGIDEEHIVLGSFAVASGLGGAVCLLLALDTGMAPTSGMNLLLMGFVALVVGGVESLMGNLVGGLIVGLVQNIGVWKLPTQWQDCIVYLTLVVFLIVRPRGILSTSKNEVKV